MFKKISLFSVFVLITVSSFSAFAKDRQESQNLLRQAMMKSNAEYNIHKGKANMEEFNRADTWVERDTHALMINQDKRFVSNIEDVQKLKSLADQEEPVGQRALSTTDN